MSEFACEKCGKGFSRKRSLTYHIEKDVCKRKNYVCKHCGNGFSALSGMYRHIKNDCKSVKAKNKEKDEIYQKLLSIEKNNKKKNKLIEKQTQEIEKLRKEIRKIPGNVININAVNSGNIINNNNNNINIIAFGYEDFSKLSNNEMLTILRCGYNAPLRLTEKIHFDPKRPENHNVYISNKKDRYAMVFDGVEWNLKFKDDVIDMLYDDKKSYIQENMAEFIGSLSESGKNALNRWVATEDKDEKILRIKREIKLLLYNKREIPLNTLKMFPTPNPIKAIKHN